MGILKYSFKFLKSTKIWCILKIWMAEAMVTKSKLKAVLKLQNLEEAEILFGLGLYTHHKVVMMALQANRENGSLLKSQAISNTVIFLSSSFRNQVK